MLYSEFITKLRADASDFAMRRYETADGDGSTTVFQLAHPKILESSYTVKVDSTAQTETTDFAINKDVGQIIFTSGSIPASGSDNVSFEYQSVNMLNADWLDIINQVLQQIRRKIWAEITDETTLTSVAGQHDYDLSGVADDVVYVLDFEYRTSSTERWVPVRSISDVVFYKDLQKLHLKQPFNTSGYELRLRVLSAYAQGTATTDDFEPQDRYHPAIRKLCQAEYLFRLAAKMSQEVSAVSKEKNFETITEMTKLANAMRDNGMKMLKEVRPAKTLSIPIKVKA